MLFCRNVPRGNASRAEPGLGDLSTGLSLERLLHGPADAELPSTAPMTYIYLDNDATTPVLPEVADAMHPYLSEAYGNPASVHAFGRRARRALDSARETVADVLDAHPEEVVFTSGGPEANNLAMFGLAGDPPAQLISSAIEHPSVAECHTALARRGFEVTPLPVEETGTTSLHGLG